MSTEDRAKELVEKFKSITVAYVLNGEANEADVLDEAKECAIICANELEKTELEMLSNMTGINGGYMVRKQFENYWQEVKLKINSL